MSVMVARRVGGSWILSLAPSTSGAGASDDIDRALERGRDELRSAYSRRLAADDVWHLEFTKAAIHDGEIALGMAHLLADRCDASSRDEVRIDAPKQWLSLRAAVQVFSERGLGSGHGLASRAFSTFRFLSAACLGVSAMLASVAQFQRGRAPKPAAADYLFAVHGEWSNRTRHLLELLKAGATPGAILVLGRPRASIAAVRDLWVRSLGCASLPPLLRPWSLGCAMRALPAMVRHFARGAKAINHQYWMPTYRDLTAICYRVALGCASSSWWRQHGVNSPKVFFGHTGMADTTMLERAQQASGCRTVHVAHGISSGVNFVGMSSVAVWRCGHDSDWHRQLGGYGGCVSFPAQEPVANQGQDILVCTNLAHPMNPWGTAIAIADEVTVLADVAAALARSHAGRHLRWRPHPALERMPLAGRSAVEVAAVAQGFERVKAEAGVPATFDAGCVITTPSSVALDALNAGACPVVLAWRPVDACTAIGQLPVHCNDVASLAAALTRLESPEARKSSFSASWSRVRPSARFETANISGF